MDILSLCHGQSNFTKRERVRGREREREGEKGREREREHKIKIHVWCKAVTQHIKKADKITQRVQTSVKAIEIEKQEKRVVENHKQKMEYEKEVLEQKADFEKNCKQQKAVLTQLTEQLETQSK